jgi:malonyl-CoA/methylmalonyl-CoA synthetase
LSDLRQRLRDRLIGYKIPQDQQIIDKVKRSAISKINKKELAKAVFRDIKIIRRKSIYVCKKRALLAKSR